MNSTHNIANVNISRDGRRKKGSQRPHDPDAKWGVKQTKKVNDDHEETNHQVEYFHDFKAHMSLNAESGLITVGTATPGNEFDGPQFPTLLKQDENAGVKYEIVAGDRSYDDGNHHYLVQHKGMHSA